MEDLDVQGLKGLTQDIRRLVQERQKLDVEIKRLRDTYAQNAALFSVDELVEDDLGRTLQIKKIRVVESAVHGHEDKLHLLYDCIDPVTKETAMLRESCIKKQNVPVSKNATLGWFSL